MPEPPTRRPCVLGTLNGASLQALCAYRATLSARWRQGHLSRHPHGVSGGPSSAPRRLLMRRSPRRGKLHRRAEATPALRRGLARRAVSSACRPQGALCGSPTGLQTAPFAWPRQPPDSTRSGSSPLTLPRWGRELGHRQQRLGAGQPLALWSLEVAEGRNESRCFSRVTPLARPRPASQHQALAADESCGQQTARQTALGRSRTLLWQRQTARGLPGLRGCQRQPLRSRGLACCSSPRRTAVAAASCGGST
mmetsp:Transcript_349/g.1197  ORF Transcript_349/g.1197 Transcript_349/m.1197 type:complete len:252 (+) Transcript_349:3473-4228(+)